MKFETKEDALAFKEKIKARIIAEQEEGRKIEENLARLHTGLNQINEVLVALDKVSKPFIVEMFETSYDSETQQNLKTFETKEEALAFAEDYVIVMNKNDLNGHISIYEIEFDDFIAVDYYFIEYYLVIQNQQTLNYVATALSTIEFSDNGENLLNQSILYKPSFYMSTNDDTDYTNIEVIESVMSDLYAKFKEIKKDTVLFNAFKTPNVDEFTKDSCSKILDSINSKFFRCTVNTVEETTDSRLNDLYGVKDKFDTMSSITIKIMNS